MIEKLIVYAFTYGLLGVLIWVFLADVKRESEILTWGGKSRPANPYPWPDDYFIDGDGI